MIIMLENESFEVVNHFVNLVLSRISMILTGEISDPVNIIFTFSLFEELPRDAQIFVINNIYVPKDKIKFVSITDMSKMQDCLKTHLK